MSSIKLFLLYSDEQIDKFVHPNIIPLKLNQTEYFESEAYRMLQYSDLPKCDILGFITPTTLEAATEYRSLNDYMNSLQLKDYKITSLWTTVYPSNLYQGIQAHGETFRSLWDYMSNELGCKPDYDYYSVLTFYRNCWIAPFNTVVSFLYFAKFAFKIVDTSPNEIKTLFRSDSHYTGALVGEACMKKFGTPYYPFHPFIFERLICLFKYMHNL